MTEANVTPRPVRSLKATAWSGIRRLLGAGGNTGEGDDGGEWSRRSRTAAPAGEEATFHFAGIDYPLEWAKLGFCCVGAPRSGKTLLLKRLAYSALASIACRTSLRAVFFDYKREYWPWLALTVPVKHLKYIEPFDPRGVAWAIARDIHDIDDAEAIGKLLAPTRPDAREPFFDETVGGICAGNLVSLHLTRGNDFTLFDWCQSMESPRSIRDTLALAPQHNRWRIEHYMSNKQPNRDVLHTLGNRIQSFAAVARRWEDAAESVSISQWMDEPFVLVLGHSHQHADATAAITRALFGRLTQRLLDEPDNDAPQNWVFLDELPSAGRLDALPDLLSKGASRGTVVAVGFQDIASLRNIYGPDLAQAINSFLGFKAFGRIQDPETAEWASKHFGEMDLLRHFVGHSWTSGRESSETVSVNPHLDRTRVVTPLDLMSIPPLCPPEVCSLGSYVISPPLGRYRYELKLEDIRRISPRVSLPPALPVQGPPRRTRLNAPPPPPPDDELPYR